jgi:methionine-rich copper-binding protein CopC
MKRLFKLSMVFLIVSQVNRVYAHAVITDHSLKTTPIHANKPEKIDLTFNSKVELELSQIFLVRKGDKHERLNIVKGRPGHIMVALPPLETGKYALRIKVFAADGHLTEDVIYFSVESADHRTSADTKRPISSQTSPINRF